MTRPFRLSAIGGGAGAVLGVEDVFSTYTYTGNGGNQLISNGIPLGDGQVGSGGSAFFDGGYGRVNVPDSSLFTLGSSWCIEAFIYPMVSQTGTIFGRWYSGSNNAAYLLYYDGSYMRGGAFPYYNSAGGPVTLNQWSHVAMTFDGTTKRFFVNGSLVASYNQDNSISSTNGLSPSIGNNTGGGAPFAGLISNLRVVSGSAVYTSAFTVPTSALTAISGTSLLCMQGASPFTDNSGNGNTLTTTALVKYDSNGPFGAAPQTGSGGMVWCKSRNSTYDNIVTDTVRGAGNRLLTRTTQAQTSNSDVTSFNNRGFGLGYVTGDGNYNAVTFVSWTFKKQPKFFDIQTYTGTGSAGLVVNHNLGSTPGCIMIKNFNPGNTDWIVYHNSIGTGGYMVLNSQAPYSGTIAVSSVSSTNFTVATGSANWNAAGQSYIAYIFAHNAGGFGESGNDDVISCGGFVTDSGGNATINLGWEPQWLLIKAKSGDYPYNDWEVYDTRRGLTGGGPSKRLQLNSFASESSPNDPRVNATGFQVRGYITSGTTSYLYIAIRRPMKKPTSGEQVYKAVTRTGLGSSPWVASGAGFPPDMTLMSARDTGNAANNTSYHNSIIDTLRRATEHIQTVNQNAEGGGWGQGHIHNMDGYDGLYSSDASYWAYSGHRYIDNHFRRAPGFMDIVYFTGTGSDRTVNHGLQVSPEMIICKRRDSSGAWNVYTSSLGVNKNIEMQYNYASYTSGVNMWQSVSASTFGVGTDATINASGGTYIAYLFATCPGVSKVGSYTGTGSPLTVNCGFTTGARFVLIKRTDSSGSWWFFDTARGMASGSSKALWLDTGGAAEVSGGYVYTTSVGFVVESSILALNTSGGNYIYLAIS